MNLATEGIGPDGVLRHSVQTHIAMRVFLIAAGAFVLVISVSELHRALWPINIFTPFFAIIIIGACLVGIPMVTLGLVGPAFDWSVHPGRIEIVLTNPFRRRVLSFTPGMVADLRVARFDDSDGPVTWRVEMKSIDGKRYQSRQYGSADPALKLKADMERIFYGQST